MASFARSETIRFLISPRGRRIRRNDERQLHRLLEYLGGVRTVAGFAFPSFQRRETAWEVLRERYGTRYFEKHDQLVAAADPV